MKGLACGKCADMRTLARHNRTPVSCACGNVTGWWLDGDRGIARYTAKAPAYALGVGFNNHFLLRALQTLGSSPTDADWRKLHDQATNAPGYLFDESRRACWAIFFIPGTVRDVEWATDEERAEVGLASYPKSHALAAKT